MKEIMQEKMMDKKQKFKCVKAVILTLVICLFLAGIIYYTVKDSVDFNRTVKVLQKRALEEGRTDLTIAVPKDLVPIVEGKLPEEKMVLLPGEYSAGGARRQGSDWLIADNPLDERELEDAGYEMIFSSGSYYLYKSCMKPGEWKITQYGTISGLQSMCYTMVSAEGDFILLDGGHNVDADNLRKLIAEFGNYVDVWICSHFHEDHIGAVTDLLADLQGIQIKELWYPQMDIDTYKSFAQEWDSVPVCERFLKETKNMEQAVVLQNGDSRHFQNLDFYVFSSYTEGQEWTAEGNNCGLIFSVKADEETMLFCCDVGNSWISERLVAGYGEKLKADYVQMGHHGNGGLSEEAYRIVAPKVAFFDGPAWLFEDTERYTATANKELMESMNCIIYKMDDAPNSIILK